ncbi:hypothetical protein, partial [Capnocytophaga ochracea]|uniref:hypothetical protein n=1 Tax=Capnocytophaga ochracea TaxID=1018 RepID=UPI002B46EE42
AFDDYMAQHPGLGQFDLPKEGTELQNKSQAADAAYNDAKSKEDAASTSVTVQQGRLIMLATVIILMVGLTYLVMFTRA